MEDFVTLEFAQKLKEKGYPLSRVIKQNGNPVIYDLPKNHPNWQDCKAYYIPTVFQVLKWLREEKEIMVFPVYSTNTSKWCCSIVNADSLDTYKLSLSDSYEQANLEGIEYVLDNLL